MEQKDIIRLVHQSKKKTKEYSLFNRIWIYLQKDLPQHINIVAVLQKIEKNLSDRLCKEVDSILIGTFDELIQRQVTALFLDGEIYLDNQISSEEELYDNIVHEVAHSLEQAYREFLYADGSIEKEYVAKQKKLLKLLASQGYNIPKEFSETLDFTSEFDKFLYQTVGYDVLGQLGATLFVSPYAITSLEEYFANGFEHYFNGASHLVRKLSPALYNKIEDICEGLRE